MIIIFISFTFLIIYYLIYLYGYVDGQIYDADQMSPLAFMQCMKLLQEVDSKFDVLQKLATIKRPSTCLKTLLSRVRKW